MEYCIMQFILQFYIHLNISYLFVKLGKVPRGVLTHLQCCTLVKSALLARCVRTDGGPPRIYKS